VVARIASGETEPSAPASASERSVDYDAIMQAGLARVFGERDPSRRIEAIRELYAADAALHAVPLFLPRGHGRPASRDRTAYVPGRKAWPLL
jgi:hypothetical protein